MIEFLERWQSDYRCEKWIVRAGGVVRNAHVYTTEDVEWTREVEAETRPWLGFVHPRIAEIYSLAWSNEHLLIVTGDERGPSFLQAAKRLEDKREREQWAVGEIVAIAEGLAAMHAHKPEPHRRVFDNLIIGADGRAKLRAPIAFVQAFKHTNYVGRGNSIGSAWGLSPEQALGLHAKPATDVFQLAHALYSAIALERPFKAPNDSDFERLKAIVDAVQPKPPSDTLGTWQVLKRSLAKDPNERYPSPAAFADALRAAVGAETPANAITKLAAFQPGMRPAPSDSVGIVGWQCVKKWEQLAPTQSEGVRYCGECKHEVVEVKSLRAVIPLLGSRCVAYRPE